MAGRSIVGLMLSIVFLAIVVSRCYSLFATSHRAAQKSACHEYLTVLGRAMWLYAEDWDDRLPPAERWSDAVFQVLVRRKGELIPHDPMLDPCRLFTCPADSIETSHTSYAMNDLLSSQKLSEIEDPRHTVLLFEERSHAWNAHRSLNNLQDLEAHARSLHGTRHKPSIFVLYADGSVRSYAPAHANPL